VLFKKNVVCNSIEFLFLSAIPRFKKLVSVSCNSIFFELGKRIMPLCDYALPSATFIMLEKF
jgi:hypothetical protein